jgi:hypothetical protein
MEWKLLAQFDKELETEYRGEMYRVRDNGSVCRQQRPNKRKRPLDEIWTFGNPSASTGYMYIGSVVVHRIIAIAFHGEQPSEKHIVDHIDTNRRNNRAENLRWITRLDNVLLNPITRRRVVLAYGSIEDFLKNPAAPLNPKAIEKNYAWMRTVSKQEAQESGERLRRWAESDQAPKGGVLDDWVYGARMETPSRVKKAVSTIRVGVTERDERLEEPVGDVVSLTLNAMQRNWRTPATFEQCPDACSSEALTEYASRLTEGTVFAHDAYGQSVTVTAQKGEDFLSVVCHLTNNPIKGWAVAKVTVENDNSFTNPSAVISQSKER